MKMETLTFVAFFIALVALSLSLLNLYQTRTPQFPEVVVTNVVPTPEPPVDATGSASVVVEEPTPEPVIINETPEPSVEPVSE